MSWVDKELRKREQRALPSRDAGTTPSSTVTPVTAAEKLTALWEHIEAANEQLPPALKLARKTAAELQFFAERSMFRLLLLSGNDAGIGLTADAVRYFWPAPNLQKSNNFWIRWNPDGGYIVARRIHSRFTGPGMVERTFDERSIEHIVKCLVTGKLVTFRSVRKRRLGLF